METKEKKIDGLEIELGHDYYITAIDAELTFEYDTDGAAYFDSVVIRNVYICGPSGNEFLAESENWDLDGLKKMVDLDWESEVDSVADYTNYLEAEREEFLDRMDRLARGI